MTRSNARTRSDARTAQCRPQGLPDCTAKISNKHLQAKGEASIVCSLASTGFARINSLNGSDTHKYTVWSDGAFKVYY